MLNYVMQGVESTPFHAMPEVEKLCGRKFDSLDAFHDFGRPLTERHSNDWLASMVHSISMKWPPIELTRFSDYREIAPASGPPSSDRRFRGPFTLRS